MADYFSQDSKKATCAFAAINFARNMASGFGYFAFNSLTRNEMAGLLVATTAFGILSYYISCILHSKIVNKEILSPANIYDVK